MPLICTGKTIIAELADIQHKNIQHSLKNMNAMIDQAVKINDAYLSKVPWISYMGKKSISAILIISNMQVSCFQALFQEKNYWMNCQSFCNKAN